MNILISGVGGPTPRSFVRALRNFGTYGSYEFVATDCDRFAFGLYQKEVYSRSFLIPKATAPEYWPTIETLVRNEKVDFAVVLPEVEVFEWAKRAEHNPLPCRALIPDVRIARELIDKAAMTKHLEPSGLVPKSFVIHRDEVAETFKSEIPFPYWIRSSTGSSGLGSLKVKSTDDLRNWITINPDVDKFLGSEFLPGRNLACKLLYYEGELVRSAVGERVNYIMAKVAPSGITGNTSFGRLLNAPDVFEVARKAMDILFHETGAKRHGFFTVDLKEDKEGAPKVTEINIRHVAFTQCFAAAGANFAEDTIRLLDNDPAFDRTFKLYEFEPGLIFLRDVDELPIVMQESRLFSEPS